MFLSFSISCMQVLIMDKFTVKVMSYSCKMSDITDEGISCKLKTPYAQNFLFLAFLFRRRLALLLHFVFDYFDCLYSYQEQAQIIFINMQVRCCVLCVATSTSFLIRSMTFLLVLNKKTSEWHLDIMIFLQTPYILVNNILVSLSKHSHSSTDPSSNFFLQWWKTFTNEDNHYLQWMRSTFSNH